jgi:hypothetical protein
MTTQFRTIFAVSTLILVLAIVVRLPGLAVPVNRDISAYATIGARLGYGELPYRD